MPRATPWGGSFDVVIARLGLGISLGKSIMIMICKTVGGGVDAVITPACPPGAPGRHEPGGHRDP